MPYKVVMDGDKHCVVKSTDGKRMGCHDSHAKALAQMKALYANEAMNEITWVDPFQYTAGKPFRIFPIGTFKRGERTIDLTAERLGQMKSNYDAQRPRWKIPIYGGHPTETQPDPPKLGNIAILDLQSDGLYATPELTDEGVKLIESGAYQYCSPGILWNGYVDEQGNEFPNVLDHLALSNKPYFGSATAIFSSDETLMKDDGVMTKLSELIDVFKGFIAKQSKSEGFMIDDPKTMIKNSYLPDDLLRALQTISRLSEELGQHDVKMGAKLSSAKKSLQDVVAEIVSMYDADSKKGSDNMDDKTPVIPAVSVDEFNALKAKADQFDVKIKAQADEFAAKLEAEKKRADEFATQFAAESKARAIEGLKARAEKFAVALPVKPDEYAEKFYALAEKDADLAKWFMAKFDTLNAQLAQSALFSQFSRENAATGEETIDTLTAKIHAEKFKSDPTKYKDALTEAGKARPDLAKAGLMSH